MWLDRLCYIHSVEVSAVHVMITGRAGVEVRGWRETQMQSLEVKTFAATTYNNTAQLEHNCFGKASLAVNIQNRWKDKKKQEGNQGLLP